jgi:hypothetical protein
VYFIVRQRGNSRLLHTIILKTIIQDVTYITALGYSGAGVFDEFCGKFHWDSKNHSFDGPFSRLFHDPDLWEYSHTNGTLVESLDSLNDFDKSIVSSHVDIIWEKLIERSEDGEDRLIRSHLFNDFGENDYLQSSDWDPDVVDWVSNHIWGLNYRFDW